MAEEPLPAGGSCLLGSINLSAFVKENKFDFTDFKKTIHTAVNALNDVLIEGLSLHPLDIQRQSVNDWRQIGLGVMGIADMLIKLQLKYDTEEAIGFCRKVSTFLASEAIKASINRAKLEGAYPKFKYKYIKDSTYLNKFMDNETKSKLKEYGIFNSQLLTIAPTGSLSTMIQISGGIEPIFANYYTRTTKSLHGHDETYRVYTRIAKDWLESNPDKELPDYFVESENINPIKRVAMQSVWQEAIDASISSTVNLPEKTTVETVEDIYMEAWKQGLKGITIFRSGCKRVAILSTDTAPSADTNIFDTIKPISRKTLGTTYGCTFLKKCACGTLYITINTDKKGNIVETFVHTSKGGICQANTNGINRLVSLSLRAGVAVAEVIDQLKGITCPSCLRITSKGGKLDGMSCPDILASTIKEFQTEVIHTIVPKEVEKAIVDDNIGTDKCPECGAEIQHEGGCKLCSSCGWSACMFMYAK